MLRLRKCEAARIVRAAALMAAVIMAAGLSAHAAPPSCPNPITRCGCVIDSKASKKNSIFTVADDLNAFQTAQPNCIEIAAPHTVLNVKGHLIEGKGDGTGIGILIRPGAHHVVVAGGDASAAPAAPADGSSEPAVVAKWNVGIEDEGDYAAIELFSNIGGFFEGIPGNNTGVVLKHAKHSVIFNVHADLNHDAGIVLKDTSDCRLSNFDAAGNDNGVVLDSSDGARISTASIMGNRKVGVWLLSSSNNTLLDCNGTEFNGDVGILLGCGPEAGCHALGSNNNRVTSCGGKNSGIAGILIDRGSGDNIVTVTHNTGNPVNADMVDNNPNCGTDLWYNNEGTGNQSCVVLNP
jgi:parallel beta-helix repeat protein